MYCVRGNFEFGIVRVMDSLRPYEQKLGPLTWFYAKRCFLALIDNLAKHLFMLRDSVRHSCIQFLQDCESTSHSRAAGYCDQSVCLSVCLSACPVPAGCILMLQKLSNMNISQ